MSENLDRFQEMLESISAGSIMLDWNDPAGLLDLLARVKDCRKTAAEISNELAQAVDLVSVHLTAVQTDSKSMEDLFALSLSYLRSAAACANDPEQIQALGREYTARTQGSLNGDIPQTIAETQLSELPGFLSDTLSRVAEAESLLMALEKDPADAESLHAVFRVFHTFKGEGNMLGLKKFGAMAHEAENILELARGGQITFESNIVSVLLEAIDSIKSFCGAAGADVKAALEFDFSRTVESLKGLLQPAEKGTVVQSKAESGSPNATSAVTSVDDTPKEEKYAPQIPQLDLAEGKDTYIEFVSEAFDHLTRAEDCILTLESDPKNKDAINSVFRAFHTIKGVAAFLNLTDIKTLAHTAETMLDMVRSDKLQFEGVVVDATFESIDQLRKLFTLLNNQVASEGELKEEYFDVGPLIASLKKINAGELNLPAEKKPIGEILLETGKVTNQELEKALDAKDQAPEKKLGEILVENNSVSAKDVNKAVSTQQGVVGDNSIKISIDKLDALNDLVGELIISETQVVKNPLIGDINDQRIIKDIAQLNHITRRLQEIAMSMRLVPIRPTFQKMVRLVRDLAKKSDKNVAAITFGEETEIDKNMVELIGDPLVHMVRNSIDHGIEPAALRAERNKPAMGTVEFRAYHKAGNVVIEIKDDGGGLNKEKILKKAIERGLVKENEILPESKIFALIFEPGFSTADKISDVSGRGVGMDVVKRNIERLRGKIDIVSELGQGTSFFIKLPVTLAIIDGIVLSVGIEKYILPITAVVEFVQPAAKDIFTVEGKGEMIKVHDQLYPIIRLDKYFQVRSQVDDLAKKTACIVDSDYGRACLLVDQLHDQQQVVIKNLGERLRDIQGVAGGTILGDGRVGLILDVNGIVELSHR